MICVAASCVYCPCIRHELREPVQTIGAVHAIIFAVCCDQRITQIVAAMVVMRALFDRVLIETVGVGQSETDVAGAADTVVFCVQPGSGDSLQFMKAGIVEIPHLVVVTKADVGAAAERARADVAGALSLATAGDADDWPVKVLAASSRSGAGMDGLMAAINEVRSGGGCKLC